MVNFKNSIKIITIICAFLILVIEPGIAVSGAGKGIDLCIKVVIPTLLPLLILTIYLNGVVIEKQSKFLKLIGTFCKMPSGSEMLFLIGILSGYPVGAQCVSDAYNAKQIERSSAHRLLGFCSNAGPAFIFGMIGGLFGSIKITIFIWIIHIVTACIVGHLLPKANSNQVSKINIKTITLTGAVVKGVKSLSLICAWITLFGVLISYIQSWLPDSLEPNLIAVITGFIELTNGIHALNNVHSEGLRFVISSTILAFGGLCVFFQTNSVTEHMGTGLYFPGKLLQTLLSFLISYVVQFMLFPTEHQWNAPILVAALGIIITVIYFTSLSIYRKNSSNSAKVVV